MVNNKLYMGYNGPAVRIIKTWLNQLVTPSPNLSADDSYDQKTVSAVRRFQMQHGAPVPNGIVDGVTLLNIVERIGPTRVHQASKSNVALRMMLANCPVPYDDDVHYELTYALAVAAGFLFDYAARIAGEDVGVDNNPDTTPMPKGAWDEISGEGTKRRALWHFVTKERLNELDQKWRNTGLLKDLGKYLHVFQDTFSHKGLIQ